MRRVNRTRGRGVVEAEVTGMEIRNVGAAAQQPQVSGRATGSTRSDCKARSVRSGTGRLPRAARSDGGSRDDRWTRPHATGWFRRTPAGRARARPIAVPAIAARLRGGSQVTSVVDPVDDPDD